MSGELDIRLEFSAEPISDADARGLLATSRAVHFKGFARGLAADAPSELIKLLSMFDVLVFDGDSLSPDSFTKAIPRAVAAARATGRSLRLLAFKYGSEESYLLGSWHKAKFQVPLSDVAGALSVSGEGPDMSRLTLISAPEPIHVVLSYVSVERLAVSEAIKHYQALGAHALQLTGAQSVVAWGGGECVLHEWRLSAGLSTAGDGEMPPAEEAIRAEARAGAGDKRITWHLFPAVRYTQKDGAAALVPERSVLCDLCSAPPHFIVHNGATEAVSDSGAGSAAGGAGNSEVAP